MSFNDDQSNPNASNHPNAGSTAANPRTPQPNPKDPNLQREPTGAIASDSLAAESLQSGGAFAENERVHSMGVKGAQSTLNNMDSSSATELEPAADAAERDEGGEQAKYPEGVGKPTLPGVHSRQGYVGSPSGEKTAQCDGGQGQGKGQGVYVTGQASSSSTGHTSGEEYRANAAVDTAPTAFGKFQREGDLKPKGKGLTEAGDDIPATKTFTGDVGGTHDPARVAEKRMLGANVNTAVAGAGDARQYETGRSTGEFDVLQSERV